MNFVKPAKADRNKVSKKEKKYAPQFGRSICRKIFSPIGRTVSEKKGENLVFTPKTGFWKIWKIMKNCFFRFFTCKFFSGWNIVGVALSCIQRTIFEQFLTNRIIKKRDFTRNTYIFSRYIFFEISVFRELPDLGYLLVLYHS